MSDLEQEIRRRYLDRLDELTWDDEDPRLDFGERALPYFVAAFGAESSPERRARLIRVIWQIRDMAALPTLAVALSDPSSKVWKEALDGIVTLGGNQARAILIEARATVAIRSAETDKLAWIDEALTQVIEGV
jgi:HEAT repeat protein